MKRAVLLLVSSSALLVLVSCGGSGNSVTGPNGNATLNAPSKLQNRAFITNQYSGNIQIVDSQNDTTAYYTVTNNNTGNTTPGGSPAAAVNIVVGSSLTWEVLSPDDLETLVYDPLSNTLTFITNASESMNGSVNLAGWASMAVYSPDSKNVYVPVPAAPITNSRPGAVQIISTASGTVSATIPVPSAQFAAISPNGNTLLVFAANSDTMYLLNVSSTSPSGVAIPGFSRPVNAFFSSDSNTAYILNCGPECGSTAGPPSVMKFDVPSQTITARVPVGGASVGLLKNTTLYVAGYPGGSTGTFDVVDVGSMTRSTPNPIVIGDGNHTTMAISNNNKMYIGAVTCANVTVGCLSIVDLGKVAADPQPTPLGVVTGMQSIPSRNVMYVIQGGVLNIYDTTTGQLQSTQIAFRGALYGVVQVDP
ncbi:MAG TPA: hypothetical protein VFB24_12750 [Candidatus Binatia bacterium]|nr:hypothetical protein [Candidatus Binatia bacterium]